MNDEKTIGELFEGVEWIHNTVLNRLDEKCKDECTTDVILGVTFALATLHLDFAKQPELFDKYTSQTMRALKVIFDTIKQDRK
jgi:hypothetical protein